MSDPGEQGRRVWIATPVGTTERTGNRVTAERWADHITALGHQVTIAEEWRGEPADLLVALHAVKSAPSVERWVRAAADSPLIVALTGTDLYRDLPQSPAGRRALDHATRIVVLQILGKAEVAPALRSKVRTIVQSFAWEGVRAAPRSGRFDVCVVGHLRDVKDPFRAALAARRLGPSSKIAVSQIGAALDPDMEARARLEARENPRYEWLGELSREATVEHLRNARLSVVSSLLEGGSNAVVEALAVGTPILASRIAGTVGLLGPKHPGLFATGDTAGLAALMTRAEDDPRFLAQLTAYEDGVRPLVEPARERQSWTELLAELWESA